MAEKPYKTEFNQAIDLWHSGDSEGAIARLETLASRYPNEAAILGMLGGYYYDAGGLREALPHLQAAVRLSPKFELAARHLFHTYYDLNELEAAKSELKRFLAATDLDEHRREWSRLLEQVESQLHAG